MHKNWSLIVLSLVTFLAPPATAIEVTPMVMSRFVDVEVDIGLLCFVPPCLTGEVGDDSTLGLILDFEITDQLDFEVLYSHQSSSIDALERHDLPLLFRRLRSFYCPGRPALDLRR